LHAVKIDRVEDHVHRVDQLGRELGIIKAVQLIKSDSLRWMNELSHRFFSHKAERSSFFIGAFNWLFHLIWLILGRLENRKTCRFPRLQLSH
jgi:hypothetical protein